MCVQGLKMEPGKRREQREKVLEGELGTKNISPGGTAKQVILQSQRTLLQQAGHQSSSESGLRTPNSTAGPCGSALFLLSVPGRDRGSQVLKYERLLFILSRRVLASGSVAVTGPIWKTQKTLECSHQTQLLISILSMAREACSSETCLMSSVPTCTSTEDRDWFDKLLLFHLNRLYSQSLRLYSRTCSI